MDKRYGILISIILLCLITNRSAIGQPVIEVAYPNLTFSLPIDFQIANGIDDTVFVAERAGVIKKLRNDVDAESTTTILNISSKVNTSGEGGLIGFTFHPDFQNTPQLFVHYTAPDPFRSVFARYTIDPATGLADSGSEFIILEIEQPFTNHNAGQIRFGPDGYLYIATGDGGSGGDPLENGQNPATLLGNILRIDINQTSPGLNYAIPPDNPFVGNNEGVREEIFAYGFRNPFRFSFDAETGELWVGDVGQSRREEINLVEIGKNYGWNTMEGSLCFDPSSGCDQTGLELPVFEYSQPGSQSVTGGFRYRGAEVTELSERYVYADFVSGNVWSFEFDGENATDNQLIDELTGNSVVCFGEDQNRELHICSFDGNIYRIGTSVVTSNEEFISERPESIQLNQNYPNPFNPATVISFTLPEAQTVTLDVYNIVGQKVASLLNSRLSAGEHSVNFDASNLASGVYIYVLKSESQSLSRTMALLK